MRAFLFFIFLLQAPLILCANENGHDVSMLCGINALYLSLQLLEEQPPSYHEILEEFPHASRMGVSLFQLKQYLEKRKFHCNIIEISEREIGENFDKGFLSIVLQETSPLPHIALLLSQPDKTVRVFDFPNFVNKKKPNGERHLSLLVGRTAESVRFEKNPVRNLVEYSLAIFGMSIVIFTLFVKCKKTKSLKPA